MFLLFYSVQVCVGWDFVVSRWYQIIPEKIRNSHLHNRKVFTSAKFAMPCYHLWVSINSCINEEGSYHLLQVHCMISRSKMFVLEQVHISPQSLCLIAVVWYRTTHLLQVVEKIAFKLSKNIITNMLRLYVPISSQAKVTFFQNYHPLCTVSASNKHFFPIYYPIHGF